jgi:hypothetical protein
MGTQHSSQIGAADQARALMKSVENAVDFVTKMEAGAFDGSLSSELRKLSHEELLQVERILIDRIKCWRRSGLGARTRVVGQA